MLKNYLKIALRNLWRNKISSVINVSGLTIGLSCCLLIGLYVSQELSFDKFQEKGHRIARVIMEAGFDGSPEKHAGNYTSTKVAPTFKRTFPEIESAVRMTDADMIVRHGDNLFKEPNFMFADSSFFDLFHAKIISGNPKKALDGPGKVVLTASIAKKYFGSKNPLGEVLQIATDSSLYQVTGVMEDYPANSQFRIDFLASFSSLSVNQEETYWNANYTTYFLLQNENAFEALQAKIGPFMKKEMAGSGASVDFHLEHFDKVHLYSPYDAFVPNTDITYLYILGGVALLILFIVCFTYINLSTARSVERAREVGVRKAIGAESNQLFGQFVGESGIVCLIAVCLSIVLVIATIPFFNELMGKQLEATLLFKPGSILFLVVFAGIVGLLAGSYPALILSRFQPVKVLKGAFSTSGSGKNLRQSLIIFQFGISIFLLVATMVIDDQLHYIQNKKVGYDRNQVVVLPIDHRMMKDMSLIKQRLKSNPNILNVSRCAATPVNIVGGYNMRSGRMPENEQMSVRANPIDEDYIKTTGLQIVAGEDLTDQDLKDAAADKPEERRINFILNESAARQLGWKPEEAVGQRMFLDNSRPGVVKAVVKDFHFASMHNRIEPLVLFPEMWGKYLLVKTNGKDVAGTLAFIGSTWKDLVPYMPFEYHFLDDDYNRLYRSELQLGKIMGFFTTLSIVLACLGLFGLTSYVVQQRIKEIGIRKVLGASVSGIVVLISSGFVKLVVIASAIAFPVAWWAMSAWLSDFVYRIEISWQLFLGAGLGVVGVTLLTVGLEAVKAALMNPVKSLKSE